MLFYLNNYLITFVSLNAVHGREQVLVLIVFLEMFLIILNFLLFFLMSDYSRTLNNYFIFLSYNFLSFRSFISDVFTNIVRSCREHCLV